MLDANRLTLMSSALTQDEEVLSPEVRVATMRPVPAARSARAASSGRPIPKASGIHPNIHPATKTRRNVTIPRTGCGSLQITSSKIMPLTR